jgi:hypothetical protein
MLYDQLTYAAIILCDYVDKNEYEANMQHTAIALFFNAARISRTRASSAPIVFITRQDALQQALATLPIDDSARQQLEQALLSANSTVADLLALLSTSPQSAATGAADTHTQRRLERKLALLCAIQDITSQTTAAQATLTFETLDLLHDIKQLHIAGTPDCVLVGLVSTGDSDTTVTLPGSSYMAQRITITYRDNSPYPCLNIATPSITPYDDRPQTRPQWVQKPHAAYDLDIYTYKDRLVGQVRTRSLDTIPTSSDQHLHFEFAPNLPVRYLVTELTTTYADTERLLARVVKLVTIPAT